MKLREKNTHMHHYIQLTTGVAMSKDGVAGTFNNKLMSKGE
jgi:hypothetical protein